MIFLYISITIEEKDTDFSFFKSFLFMNALQYMDAYDYRMNLGKLKKEVYYIILIYGLCDMVNRAMTLVKYFIQNFGTEYYDVLYGCFCRHRKMTDIEIARKTKLENIDKIAKKLGILKDQSEALTGTELEKMTDEELTKNVRKYSVYARVSPEHKVRIVKAWQANGEIVAMTGDGVNDAPALKNADIGIAMGKGGTDVAKNASDMVLTDDNFVTIVEAVKQGRNIYDNIKKAVHFLLATNIGEIVAIFVGLLLGIKSPLLAIQLLWVNLVTDSLPAIALGLEKAENNIMNRLPRNPRKSLFADGLWGKITTEGVMIGVLTLVAFSIGNNLYSIEVGRTMAFLSLGILELVHSFNIKGEESILKTGLFENRYLVGALVLGTLLQVVVVVISPLAQIFDVVTLNSVQWLMTVIISILPVVIVELQKKFNAYKFGKVVYARSV